MKSGSTAADVHGARLTTAASVVFTVRCSPAWTDSNIAGLRAVCAARRLCAALCSIFRAAAAPSIRVVALAAARARQPTNYCLIVAALSSAMRPVL